MTVNGVFAAVNFEHRDRFVAINLIPGWVFCRAFELVPPCHIIRVHVLQAELADVEYSVTAVLLRVRRSIPGLNLIPTNTNTFDLAWRSRELLGRAAFVLEVSFCRRSLELPFLLGFLPGFVKFHSIGLQWQCLGGFRVDFRQNATIRFGLEIVILAFVESIERRCVMR